MPPPAPYASNFFFFSSKFLDYRICWHCRNKAAPLPLAFLRPPHPNHHRISLQHLRHYRHHPNDRALVVALPPPEDSLQLAAQIRCDGRGFRRCFDYKRYMHFLMYANPSFSEIICGTMLFVQVVYHRSYFQGLSFRAHNSQLDNASDQTQIMPP